MKILFWIVAVPALAVAMSFGVSNPQSVSLRLWPLVNSVEMPLYAAVAIALFFGLLLGGLIGSFEGLRHRAEARRLARRLRDVETEEARLRGELARMTHDAAHAAPAEPDPRRLTVATYD